MKPTEMKVMLFAAGLGTRLQPFTLNAPKALYPVNGKPLLQRNIEYLKSYGFQDFVINTHHFADKILDFLKEHEYFGVKVEISDEKDDLLETGGGLLKARHLLGDQTFLVMNADILTDLPIEEFLKFHSVKKPLVSLAVSDRESSRKLLFDAGMRLCGWKDNKTGEIILESEDFVFERAFSGMHIIEPGFFELNPFQGKFSIMRSYMQLMKNQQIYGFDHTGFRLVDVGKPESVAVAEELFP